PGREIGREVDGIDIGKDERGLCRQVLVYILHGFESERGTLMLGPAHCADGLNGRFERESLDRWKSEHREERQGDNAEVTKTSGSSDKRFQCPAYGFGRQWHEEDEKRKIETGIREGIEEGAGEKST